jgi:predicted ester cyclase
MVLFRIEDSKIVELWGTSDRIGMLTQLGILTDIG